MSSFDLGPVLAQLVNITGEHYNKACDSYEETSWFFLFKKLRLRRVMRRRDIAFMVAFEMQRAYLLLKRDC